MPRKGLRSIFFHSKASPSHSLSSPGTPSSAASPSHSLSAPGTPSSAASPQHSTFSELTIDENFANAEAIISKWDINSSTFAKFNSLFYSNRREASDFLRSVQQLQQAMQFFSARGDATAKLVRGQHLMQAAMKRLQKEFYQILAANRDRLDPDSVSTRSSTSFSSVSDTEDEVSDCIQEVELEASLAMMDLCNIAQCMIGVGYGKECTDIYKLIRKSIVDESIYRLGFERLTSQNLHKLDWDVLELKLPTWLHAFKVSMKTLFSGERMLCDSVFSSSNAIRESCFADISKDGALSLLAFPELVAKHCKSPEKIFRLLDMYDAITDVWPEIESIFSFESSSVIRAQGINSLIKLGEVIRGVFADFESAIHKDKSRSLVPGGGLHPLTRYVMNCVCFLGDYSVILAEIFADHPLQVQGPLPDTLLENTPSPENPLPSAAVRIEWLILLLLCKLDCKADLYKNAALSYLFLANNLHYVVSKVRGCNLHPLLGEEWLSKHEGKVFQYMMNYERMAWNKVEQSLPAQPPATVEEAKAAIEIFNSEFKMACRAQSGWVVLETRLRDHIETSIVRKIVSPYLKFCSTYLPKRDSFNLSSQELDSYLSNLFHTPDSSLHSSH